MKLFLALLHLSLLNLIGCYPNSLNQYSPGNLYQDPNLEYVPPTFYGHIPQIERRSSQSTSLLSYVTDNIMSGLHYINRAFFGGTTINQNAISYPFDEDGENFVRSRRHENITKAPENSTSTIITTTMVPTTTQAITTTEFTTTASTTTIASATIANSDNATIQLQIMIEQLNEALSLIKAHGNDDSIKEVNDNSTVEEIVQHISYVGEQLSDTKGIEARRLKIKEIMRSLNILLNRVAVTAKEVAKNNPGENLNRTQVDPNLMFRIVKHISELKAQNENEKLNSAIELTSAELDRGLPSKLRPTRQEDDNANDIDGDLDTEDVSRPSSSPAPGGQPERQESDSSEEGGGNLIANLLSSFLGSLSTPTGGVDVDAIVGLVSGLSVQRDDGSYDFSGITDLLQSFLGGDEDGGGGSDVGSFLGGLLGAILQGSANPPGAQGTGRLTGNLLAAILPGLSGPAPSSDEDKAPGKPIDSGSFIAGILTSMLGASSGSSSGSKGGDTNTDAKPPPKHQSFDFIIQIKNHVVKAIFSLITKLLSASSAGVTAASGASSGAKHKEH